jgi:hypothetical protein
MQQYNIRVDDIEVGERHRALSSDAVARLASSLKEIGLRQPITIRIVDEMMVAGELTAGVPVLVAGHHRLEAAKSLGWSHIDCMEVDDDAINAELWEISENLHRLDLTKEQRDDHIRRYAELLEERRNTQPRQNDAPVMADGRRRGPQHDKGVAREISEGTGVSLRTVQRVLNPPERSEPPKEVFDVHERNCARLMSAWNSATEIDRQWFRDWIDTPLMDQRYGG